MENEKNLKVLFIGDISARPGRYAVKEVLPMLKKERNIDLVIANCENAAGGRGVTREILNELMGYGIDYFTVGEHVWDIEEFREDLMDANLPLVRPYNYEAGTQVPGKGWDIIDLGSKGKIVVVAYIGQVFMREHVRNPFWSFDELYEEIKNRVGDELINTPIIIDFHAEATAEKASFAWYVADRVTAVCGTHTHVGTIDTKIIARDKNSGRGCAYVSDVGMCGPYDASLWVSFDSVLHNFRYPYKKAFKVEMEGQRVFNSVLIEIQKNSSLKISRIDKILA